MLSKRDNDRPCEPRRQYSMGFCLVLLKRGGAHEHRWSGFPSVSSFSNLTSCHYYQRCLRSSITDESSDASNNQDVSTPHPSPRASCLCQLQRHPLPTRLDLLYARQSLPPSSPLMPHHKLTSPVRNRNLHSNLLLRRNQRAQLLPRRL